MTTTPTTPKPSRHWLILLVVVVLAGGGIAGYFLWPSPEVEEPDPAAVVPPPEEKPSPGRIQARGACGVVGHGRWEAALEGHSGQGRDRMDGGRSLRPSVVVARRQAPRQRVGGVGRGPAGPVVLR